MGSAHKVFSGVVWSITANILSAVSGFIATPYLINYFGRSEYGLISLATSVNGYMAIMDLGLSSTNVRFFSNWIAKGDTEKVKGLMQTCTAFYSIIGVINAVILVALSISPNKIFNVTTAQSEVLTQLLLMLAFTAIINWYTSCFGQLISATENVAWVQKRNVVSKILYILVVVLTLWMNLDLVHFYLGTIIANLIILPATIRKVFKEASYISFLPRFDYKIFKSILPYSLGIFSFAVFQSSYTNLRTVFLGVQGNVESLTDNSILLSIVGLVSIVGRVFIGTLLPSTSRIVANNDKERYEVVAYRGTHYITAVLCFCSFGLITVGEDLMMVYVGSDFMHLIPWLNIMLVLTITSNVSAISSLVLASSNLRPLLFSSASACISGLVACWFSIPYLQVGGVVIAMIVYNVVQQLFYYLYYWPKILKINSWRIFIHTDVPFILSGLFIVLLLDIIPHFANHWINIFVLGTLFSILYLGGCFFILTKDDRRFIYKVVKER